MIRAGQVPLQGSFKVTQATSPNAASTAYTLLFQAFLYIQEWVTTFTQEFNPPLGPQALENPNISEGAIYLAVTKGPIWRGDGLTVHFCCSNKFQPSTRQRGRHRVGRGWFWYIPIFGSSHFYRSRGECHSSRRSSHPSWSRCLLLLFAVHVIYREWRWGIQQRTLNQCSATCRSSYP